MKNIFKIIVCLGVALLAAGIVAYILYGKRVGRVAAGDWPHVGEYCE